VNLPLRHCGHCGEDKPPSEYGTSPYCRACVREITRNRRAVIAKYANLKKQQGQA
jgi:predicted nucleic acid-binding Zn ribbon protein